ncbi:hypothetical protein EQ718_14105 (plasmid) [Paracoccus versutus]|uniref:Uncharacterized protein n=1 Tax=Paracoccus versutus TaxID=34007 RepID=A0AAQ0HD73_PARVE|nr:hypothetical protein [Paracoccus versutus]REG28209.1 hypothetical protein ATH84_10657 [Paracoccus versutus]WEJ80058.1 hypothetical protein EQ718_14105 [Paracoccus versutus]
MNKRVLLGGAAVVVIAVVVAGAQIFPRGDQTPDGLVTQADDNPFAGLDKVFIEEGPDLGLTEEQRKAEEDYLDLRLDRSDTSAVLPIEGARNEPYRTCEKVPELKSTVYNDRVSDEGFATRSIYDFVKYKHALDKRDCTCAGKVAPFQGVNLIKAELTEKEGEDWNRFKWGEHYQTEGRKIRDQVEAMCGGEF